MTYLSRPVFEFPIDWGNAVNGSFDFDQKAVALGFGAEVNTTLQSDVATGWTANVWLSTEAEIVAYDTFTTALSGRLVGFWFPAPLKEMIVRPSGTITQAETNTQFEIVGQNLAATWGEHPDIHLYFTQDGEAPVAAVIWAVTDLGSGVERVQVHGPVTFLSANTIIRRLHYVRLADDLEKARFEAEGWQVRELRVIELPTEYSAVETGAKKIFLYDFWCAQPIDHHWYFTSFAAPVYSGGHLHTAGAITHGTRRNGVAGDDTLDLSTAWSADHPLALFFPVPLSVPMNIRVSETTYGDPDTVTVLFTGRVGAPVDNGAQLKVKCETFGGLLRRKVPVAMIKPSCNNQLMDRNCRVAEYLHKTTAVIQELHLDEYPPTIVVKLDSNTVVRRATNYWAQGWIESRSGLNFEIRTILASTYTSFKTETTLTLNLPLLHAAVGQRLLLTPGCDGLAATCRIKFGNFINWSGFEFVPVQNPSLKSVDQDQSVGNKK